MEAPERGYGSRGAFRALGLVTNLDDGVGAELLGPVLVPRAGLAVRDLLLDARADLFERRFVGGRPLCQLHEMEPGRALHRLADPARGQRERRRIERREELAARDLARDRVGIR